MKTKASKQLDKKPEKSNTPMRKFKCIDSYLLNDDATEYFLSDDEIFKMEMDGEL